MIWHHTDKSELKMKYFKDEELIKYLERIKTETLLAYGVYQVEAEGLKLFEYIKGDQDSIMGLPIKQILNYIKQLKMNKKSFAIIGSPIEHSLSPFLHNYWFKKYKIDGNYSLLSTKEENLKNIIKSIRDRKLNGINVTLPFKQKIIPFVDKLVNDAQNTNSVNTIYLDDTNSIVGENTDVFGLQAAYLKEINNTENKKALVIGAGGVSPICNFFIIKI